MHPPFHVHGNHPATDKGGEIDKRQADKKANRKKPAP
jgi:hypothetical protein